ncbi:MAG: eIF2A-related protein [bacterium]
MKKTLIYLFIFTFTGLSFLILFPANSQAKIYINIYSARIRKIRVAVPDFKNISAYGQHKRIEKNAARIIRHDLSVIGYFHVVNPLSYLENPQYAPISADKIGFSNWSVLNAQYLITAEYKTSNGIIKIKANLISVYTKKLLFSEKLEGLDGQYRFLANKFADDILKFLTGIKGPFTTRVFFVGEKDGSKNIFVMDFGGHRVKKVTNDGSINIFPYPSPHGNKVAYISFKDGNPAVYIKNLKSGGTVRLNLAGPADYVAWSPSGNKLIVALTPDHYNTELYSVNSDGGDLKRLTFTGGINTSASFSPDGNRIVFVSSRGGSPQIYIMNSNGSDQHRITYNNSSYNSSPAWSPDGKKIAFTSFVDGSRQVYIMNADGSGERQVTSTPYSAQHPAWTRDSRIITFDTEIAGRQELYMIDVNESGMMKLMPRMFPEMQNYYDAEWTLKSSY